MAEAEPQQHHWHRYVPVHQRKAAFSVQSKNLPVDLETSISTSQQCCHRWAASATPALSRCCRDRTALRTAAISHHWLHVQHVTIYIKHTRFKCGSLQCRECSARSLTVRQRPCSRAQLIAYSEPTSKPGIQFMCIFGIVPQPGGRHAISRCLVHATSLNLQHVAASNPAGSVVSLGSRQGPQQSTQHVVSASKQKQ
jgi:hypothetical protein